ncbi:MAG: furin-like repeat-containing protein [Nitrosopumilaceae archaeon]
MIKKFTLALFALVLLSPAYVYAAPGILTVDFEGKFVDINYDATGLEILGSQIIDEGDGFASLILEVDVTDSTGILEITIDRNFFDSKFEGVDDVFIIIADGDEPNSEEIGTTTQSRTLRIELPAGTDEVEIIGTEFVMEETMMPEPEPPAPEVPETPAPEVPETPTPEVPETPSEPTTECGPGTVLEDGVCVVKCGPGTVFDNGECVVSPTAKKGDTSISRDFITGGGIALGIALLMIIFFAIIARASRTQTS